MNIHRLGHVGDCHRGMGHKTFKKRRYMKTMRLMILALAMALSASVSEAKTLIVYYSYTNHVKEMVDDLSNIIVADVVRIEPTDKSGGYELNNYAKGTRLLNAIRNNPDALNSYPTIEPLDIKWADYDRVVIGTPLWWSQMAAVTQTFLFMNRTVLATKQLYLMVSSYSSSISGVEEDAHQLIPGGSFVSPSLWINNARHANRRSLIREWVNEVHLNEATAISSATMSKQKHQVAYDLSGHRVHGTTSGLVIMDGKKIVRRK